MQNQRKRIIFDTQVKPTLYLSICMLHLIALATTVFVRRYVGDGSETKLMNRIVYYFLKELLGCVLYTFVITKQQTETKTFLSVVILML